MQTLTRIVEVGGRRFALGMNWRYLAGLETTTPQAEARALAREMKRPFGVPVIMPNASAVGFTNGVKRPGKLYSAALAIGAGVDGDALAIIKLDDDAYWLAAYREGHLDIEADLDVIVGPDRARQILQSRATEYMAAQQTHLPLLLSDGVDIGSTWSEGQPRAALEQLLLPLGDVADNARIQKLNVRSARERLLLVVLIGAPLLVIGDELWTRYQQQQVERQRVQQEAAARNQAVDAANNEALREEALRQAVQDAIRADTAGPAPADVYRACRAFRDRIGFDLAGWELRGVQCDGVSQSATASFRLTRPPITGGDPASIMAAGERMQAAVNVEATLRDATLSIGLDLEAREPIQDPMDLPPQPKFIREEGTRLVHRNNSLPGQTFTLGAFAPRPISYTDPTAVTADGGPQVVEVPANRGYREAVLEVRGDNTFALPVDILDLANVRLNAIQLGPPATPVTTLTFKVYVAP